MLSYSKIQSGTFFETRYINTYGTRTYWLKIQNCQA